MQQIEELIETVKTSDYTGPNGDALRDVDFDRLEDAVASKIDEDAEFMRELDDIYEGLKDLPLSDLTDRMFEDLAALVDRFGKLL